MDPALDPPPLPDQPTAALPLAASASAAASTVANPTPAHASAHNHPPYAEMITASISALNERDGSSKRAIAKYIESQYSDLPSTHDSLLTHHLKRLKINGQLLMVKHSYKLPGSASAPVNGAVNAVPSDPASSGPKRRPGRPPKPKPDSVQVAVPVFEPPINMNAVPVSVLAAEPSQPNVVIGPANGPAAAGGQPVRGRGRPPKSGGLKRGPGRPPASGGLKRGPGRPPKTGGPTISAAHVRKGPGRPRGRPPKPINVVEGLVPTGVPAAPGAAGRGVAPVAGKRRGRPPRAGGEKRPRNVNAGQPNKPRQLSGKPLGRPKKELPEIYKPVKKFDKLIWVIWNASATPAKRSPDSQLLVAYLDLKAKLENLQSRIGQTANLIKPSLTNEAAINALQELELIAMNVTTPPAAVAQNQQPPQPEQYPHQPQQPQQPEQYPQQPEN
ncbi:histone h1.2 [Phtheirospermum japonicum]|uniref:Histone h1.2 n=1 Tax=Phtheirospermum japonicum TaxID=374723 RepID=A0A830BR23_9LAMI|nr:histone h1.2 [Phtheirospermum japonicum]